MGFSGGSSNQSSSGYGYNQSLAQSVNGQSIWGPQAQQLTNLYGQAQKLMGQQQGQVGSTAQGLANGGVAASQGAMTSLGKIANMQGPLAQYAQPNSALAKQQLASATGDIQQNFLRNIMPGITSGAGLSGNIGGSRQALAQGVAAGDAASAIGRAGTDIYSNMWNTGAQAAAGLTDAASQAAGMIPQMAQGIYNLGMSPFQAQWAPFTSMAGILGGPQALSYGLSQAQSQGEQSQQSTGKSSQFGFSFF